MAMTEVKEETTTKKTGWQEHATGQRDATNKLITDQASKSIESVNKATDDVIAKAEKDTEKAIGETTDDYLEILDSAAIQKELDLRDIRETRANMGLSRSGLSATEQTAAILSAGNKTAEAQRNRQKAIDSLNEGLAEHKREAESKRAADILKIEQQRDADILKNNQSWNNWLFDKNEKNDTDLVNAVISGNIDIDTYNTANENGLTAGEAIISYAPTKEAKDYDNLILGWLNEGKISPELYDKIKKERPDIATATKWAVDEINAKTEAQKTEEKKSVLLTWMQQDYISPELCQKAIDEDMSLEDVAMLAEQENDKNSADEMYKSTVFGFWQSGVFSKEQYDEIMAKQPPLDDVISLAMQQSEKNAEAAAKIEAQQKETEANQKAETNRVNGLYDAHNNGLIGDDAWNFAFDNNLSVKEALAFENTSTLLSDKGNNAAWEYITGRTNISRDTRALIIFKLGLVDPKDYTPDEEGNTSGSTTTTTSTTTSTTTPTTTTTTTTRQRHR